VESEKGQGEVIDDDSNSKISWMREEKILQFKKNLKSHSHWAEFCSVVGL
jgi:hypothetical protein